MIKQAALGLILALSTFSIADAGIFFNRYRVVTEVNTEEGYTKTVESSRVRRIRPVRRVRYVRPVVVEYYYTEKVTK